MSLQTYKRVSNSIKAIELTIHNIKEVYELVNNTSVVLKSEVDNHMWERYEGTVKDKGMKLKTPESGEGTQIISMGDFVVQAESDDLGVHYYPVKPDYFHKYYNVTNDDTEVDYKKIATALWDLLDDIDSSCDWLKPSVTNGIESFEKFYEYAMSKQQERHQYLGSDGYILDAKFATKINNKQQNK